MASVCLALIIVAERTGRCDGEAVLVANSHALHILACPISQRPSPSMLACLLACMRSHPCVHACLHAWDGVAVGWGRRVGWIALESLGACEGTEETEIVGESVVPDAELSAAVRAATRDPHLGNGRQ